MREIPLSNCYANCNKIKYRHKLHFHYLKSFVDWLGETMTELSRKFLGGVGRGVEGLWRQHVHRLGGLRLNLNPFHTTYQSQQAVYNLTYCLISLRGGKKNLLVRDETDTQTPSATANMSSDARVCSYTFNLTWLFEATKILFYSSVIRTDVSNTRPPFLSRLSARRWRSAGGDTERAVAVGSQSVVIFYPGSSHFGSKLSGIEKGQRLFQEVFYQRWRELFSRHCAWGTKVTESCVPL